MLLKVHTRCVIHSRVGEEREREMAMNRAYIWGYYACDSRLNIYNVWKKFIYFYRFIFQSGFFYSHLTRFFTYIVNGYSTIWIFHEASICMNVHWWLPFLWYLFYELFSQWIDRSRKKKLKKEEEARKKPFCKPLPSLWIPCIEGFYRAQAIFFFFFIIRFKLHCIELIIFEHDIGNVIHKAFTEYNTPETFLFFFRRAKNIKKEENCGERNETNEKKNSEKRKM